MMDQPAQCLNCRRASAEVPLIRLEYAGREHWICPQCLPVLIHRPDRLPAVSGEWTRGAPAEDEH